jgi:hypothetical protein
MALEDAPTHDTAVFHNAPVVMLLAIFAAFLAAQKHEVITPLLDDPVQWGRSALQAITETDPRKIKGSSAFRGRNIPEMGLSPRSRVKQENSPFA